MAKMAPSPMLARAGKVWTAGLRRSCGCRYLQDQPQQPRRRREAVEIHELLKLQNPELALSGNREKHRVGENRDPNRQAAADHTPRAATLPKRCRIFA